MSKINLVGHNKKNHLLPKIGISGAANIGFLGEKAYEEAKELGREISRQGAIIMSGATTGFPYWVAAGYKEIGGMSIGFSPASSVREHIEIYRLPTDFMDFITYTGFGYAGRDLLFTRSCDAIIIGPGRIGTFHEFTIAFEDQKPVGVLMGESESQTDEILKMMIERSHRPHKKIIFDDNPKRLVERLIKMVYEDSKILRGYNNYDGVDKPRSEKGIL